MVPPPTNKILPMKSFPSKMALLLQYLCDHVNVICSGSGALRGDLLSILTSISCPSPFPQSVSYPPFSPSLPSICFQTSTSVQSSNCALPQVCHVPNCILSHTCLNHPICVMSPNRLLSPACIHMHFISPVSFPPSVSCIHDVCCPTKGLALELFIVLHQHPGPHFCPHTCPILHP